MRIIRKAVKPVSILLTMCMMLLSLPHKTAFAGIIGTETVLNATRGQEARDYLNRILTREDVQASLIAQGIDPVEARARIDSLSDAEVVSLAEQIEQLPPGGNAVAAIVGAVLIVFLILLLTDILGLTDIFPFVKKSHK